MKPISIIIPVKIQFLIEFETDASGTPQRMKINRVHEIAPVCAKDAPTQKMAKIAAVAPPPIPAEPEPEKKVERKGSGPQFDPGFLKIILDAPEPFTRRSVSVASGVDVVDVTQRFIRLAKRGWIEQPAKNMWRRTRKFGIL